MAIVVGDTLYFSASDGSSGNELWAHGYYGESQSQDKLLVKLELTNRLRVKTNVLMLLLDIILLELRTLQHQVTTTLHHKYLVKQERTALKIQLLIAAYPEQVHTQAQSGYYSPGTTGGTNVDSTVTTIASNELPCPAGTYSSFSASNSSADRASCFDAPAGSYSEGTYTLNGQTIVAISATQCSAGTWQDQTGQTSCKWSDFGYYVGSTGQTEQTPCEAGTYTSSSPRSACTPASSGYYSPGTVGGQNVDSSVNTAVNQIMCHAGYYSSYTTQTPNTDRVECTEVEAGYYSPGTYTMNGTHFPATEPTPCTNGTWQDQTGQASCMDASVGYYVELTTQISQQPCEAGKYQPATGQSSCIEANAGYYSPGTVNGTNVDSSITTAAAAQIPCPAGTFQALSAQASCDNAQPGNYSLGTYTVNGATQLATSQTACDAGTYQPNSAQSSCIDADAGYYAHSGTVSGDGAHEQQVCETGKWQNQTGQSECKWAEVGYYSEGTTTLNGVVTNLANQQIPCSGGNYSGQGTSLAPGYSGASSCTTALNGYYSNGTISVNGVIEPASEQIPCPAGTYQPYVAQSSCIDASAGFYANGTQGGFNVASTVTGTSENQERCYEGTWQNQTGQASCHLAESGYYSIGTQTYNGSVTYLATQQVACPAGTYSNYIAGTAGTDRVSCTDVDAGYYSSGTVVVNGVTQKATEMTPCPAGTFQDMSGQASCNNAPAGYYSLGTHTPTGGILTPATEPTQCAAGTYQPLAGQDDCVDASVGYYSPGTSYSATSGYYNATSQVPCKRNLQCTSNCSRYWIIRCNRLCKGSGWILFSRNNWWNRCKC